VSSAVVLWAVCVLWQVTNRSKERDLDKDFADVYEQSDLHKCAMHPLTMSLFTAPQFLRCNADVMPQAMQRIHIHQTSA
jgi:hypothetical protein